MKRIIKVSFISSLALLTFCNTDEKIDGYKAHEIIVVTLGIETKDIIEKITLTSSEGRDSILKNEIANRTSLKLKSPQKGEGTFTICVYTSHDTICSKGGYVEGGYRPELKFKNNKFETVKWL